MGQLSTARVQLARPFVNSRMDYAVPFYVKQGYPRSNVQAKSCGVIFICLAVKAIHLEVASNLTSDTFIAVL
jgi:hypothetical protein